MLDQTSVLTTPNLHLATWLLYQEGASCTNIETRPGRGPQLRSMFTIDVSCCTRSLHALLEVWRSGQALVEISQYEQTRRALLDNMYAMHRAYRETTDDRSR
jgi:hypothetical protein